MIVPHGECSTFSYDLSPGPDGEQALYDATTAYLLHACGRALDNRPAVRLAMSVFQRRLASSSHALLRSFERRIGKIEQSIDDLRSGSMSAAKLRRRQHGLDRDHRNDFFDLHSADEDALDDGSGERNEDCLVRRLEGLGFSGQVAQIHGGMAWPEREEQVEFFRRSGGARYLVATDAAGEGINLQFCRLMVNYDVPWNPARLEQRMGRIHRYRQRHDVHIVNLVAGGTHEGRVLQVLFEKLEAIRDELRSDKVFDVIGRLFDNVSLREYMIEALTDDGVRRVLDRLESGLTGTRAREIEQADERVYGQGEDRSGEVAARLGGLRRDLDRERYLQLLPGYVRRFVEKSAGLLDVEVRGDLDGYFSLTNGTGSKRSSGSNGSSRWRKTVRSHAWRLRPIGSSPAMSAFSPMFSSCPRATPRSGNAMTRASRRLRFASPLSGRGSVAPPYRTSPDPNGRASPGSPTGPASTCLPPTPTARSAASRSRAVRAGGPSRWKRTSGSRRVT